MRSLLESMPVTGLLNSGAARRRPPADRLLAQETRAALGAALVRTPRRAHVTRF